MSETEFSESSGSSSDSEREDIGDVLRGVGMNKKYGKLFAKANIEDIDDARELTERRLRKIGISSASDRKKILKAIARAADSSSDSGSSTDSASDSDSESDSDSDDGGKGKSSEIIRVLERGEVGRSDAKKIASKLKKVRITSLKSAQKYKSKLNDKELKEIGVSPSATRAKVIAALSPDAKATKGSKTAAMKKTKRSSGSGSLSDKSNKSTKSSASNKSNGSKGSKNSKSPSRKTKKDESKEIARILRKVGLGSVALKFDEFGIDTIVQARALSPTKLKQMGIDTLSARSTILNAFSKSSLDEAASKKSKSRNRSRSRRKTTSSVSSGSDSDSETSDRDEHPILKALKRANMEKHFKLFQKRKVENVRQAQELGHNELRDLGIDNFGQREIIIEVLAEADWKCVYCQTWNENRKVCVVCQKTHRKRATMVGPSEDGASGFELEQKVKYIGRFRPTTRIKYGDKGTVHRILQDDCYMVKFLTKDKKVLNIRLQHNELAGCK